jgi:hypothetical protein
MWMHDTDFNPKEYTDTALQLLYMRKMEEIYERSSKKKTAEDPGGTSGTYINYHIEPKSIVYDYPPEPGIKCVKTEGPAIINNDAVWDQLTASPDSMEKPLKLKKHKQSIY